MILYLCSMKKEEMIALLATTDFLFAATTSGGEPQGGRPFGGDYVVEKPS